VNGILLVDKPQGLSSHDIVRRVRRIYGTRKVGHTGTLDPLATGVLPVALGDATRLVQYIMEGSKRYRATLRLGAGTDTQDSEGRILYEGSLEGIDEASVRRALAGFLGEQLQLPPMYSALKKDGVPLYKLARAGTEVEREPRPIRIDAMDVVSVSLPEVVFEVACSKGTYVRTLCHDLGERLGCGAHMTALRRLRSEPFGIEQCFTLSQIEAGEARLLSLEEACGIFPAMRLDDRAASRLANGIPPSLDQLEGEAAIGNGEVVALFRGKSVAALARFEPDRVNETRGDFVLLNVFTGGL